VTQPASRIQFPINCWLIERHTGKTVPGQIAPTTKRDLVTWTQWRYRAEDDDKNWDWWGIFLESQRSKGRYECYSLIAGGILQGLMVLDFKLRKIPSSRALIVDFLATNPANRTKERGLKYVGLALLSAAIERGIECGTLGAIWLESLLGAEPFYLSLGMTRQIAISREGPAAKQLLEEIRVRGIIEA
jgi:hypothetical protein